MSQPVTITVVENGPLKVSGDALSLEYCGEPVAVEEGSDVFLCRCGESKNAPFCDGSHSTSGWVAEPPSNHHKELQVWEGRTIRTHFNPNVCMHVYYCKPLKELRQRELEGDAAAAEEIARVVLSCPSGALTYESKEVGDVDAADGPQIDVIEGGEVRVQCEFDINADLHEGQPNDRATLCRCGLSKNKPWCDGRHKLRRGFR